MEKLIGEFGSVNTSMSTLKTEIDNENGILR